MAHLVSGLALFLSQVTGRDTQLIIGLDMSDVTFHVLLSAQKREYRISSIMLLYDRVNSTHAAGFMA